MQKIGIIIPTYNEEENIASLVDKIKSYIPDIEIFVVDDSIKNLSEKILENKKLVYYFHRGKKLGRGTAVIFGLEQALKNKSIDILIEMDADFSHNPDDLITLYNTNADNAII